MAEKVKAELKITKADLKEWFGEEMPMAVFQYLFVDAPKEATINEVKAHVRQMAMDFRSPESLASQAFLILSDLKKDGNLIGAMKTKIDAWQARYFLHQREVDAENGRLARIKEGFENDQSSRGSDTPADAPVSGGNANKPSGSMV